MGARVIAVSRKNWIKTDFGADHVINDYDKVVEQVKEITRGNMAEVVMNSLGIGTWQSSVESVGINGRLVTFGGLTGADVKRKCTIFIQKSNKIKRLYRWHKKGIARSYNYCQ